MRRKLLGMGHERTNKFHSQAGVTMLRNREHRDIMRAMLGEKKGAAFDVVPAVAALPAWGVVDVTVTCMGDMPGAYRDELVLDVEGLPVSRLPIKVGVVGSPLRFMDNVVGMLLFKTPAMLTFGQVVKHTPPVRKVFKVQNTSPMHAEVLWKMQPDFDDEPPVVTIAFDVVGSLMDDAPVNFTITPYSDDASPPPFTISPQVGRVPAHGTATFTVEATPVNPPEPGSGKPQVGPCFARFVADAKWARPGAEGSLTVTEITDNAEATEGADGGAPAAGAGAGASTTGTGGDGSGSGAGAGSVRPEASVATTGSGATGTVTTRPSEDLGGAGEAGTVSRGCLVLRTHIEPVEPRLHIDKRTPSGKKDKLPFIKFGVWSTHPATHPSHCRQITLTNQLPTALTFTLAIEGPFTLLNARSHAPKHPLQAKSQSIVNRPLSAGSTRMFTLPHLNNIVLDIQFNAGVAITEYNAVANPLDTSMSTTKASANRERTEMAKLSSTGPLAHLGTTPSVMDDASGKLKHEYRGAVVVTYSNGHVQRVGLRGEILRPMVAATPPVVVFGHVHVEGYARANLHVGNPTPVDAEWHIAHLPVPPPKPRVTIDARALGLSSKDGGLSLAALGLTPPPEAPREVPVDDPSVFEFSTTRGVLPGPTPPLDVANGQELRVSIPGGRGKLLRIRAVFRPTQNVLYRSRFRLQVRKGESFDVVLEGHGSYEEMF